MCWTQKRFDEARDLKETICCWFNEGTDTADLRRARDRLPTPQCIEATTLLLPAKKRFTDRIEPMNGARRNWNTVGIERDIAMATLGLADGAAGIIIKFQ